MKLMIDGLNIEYKDSGTPSDNREVAVILQGWGTNLGVYDYVASCIDSKYRVIQFDFPGFGDSDEPYEAWNVDSYADFFERFMCELEIQKATLIGHSYGGRVIIKLASRGSLPFEIKDIVLVDSAGVLPERTREQKRKIARYKMLKKVLNTKLIYNMFPELVDDWRSRQGSEDYRNASPIMRQCLVMSVNEDLTHLFSKIDKEVLLIWGDKDTATPISDARKMEKLMPRAGLAVIPGTGHFCFLDNPVVFKNIMHAYFKIGDNQ